MHILYSLFSLLTTEPICRRLSASATFLQSHICDKRFGCGKDAHTKLGSTNSKDKTKWGLVMPLACIRSHWLLRGLFCLLLQRPTGGVPVVHHTAAALTASNHLPGAGGALGGRGRRRAFRLPRTPRGMGSFHFSVQFHLVFNLLCDLLLFSLF